MLVILQHPHKDHYLCKHLVMETVTKPELKTEIILINKVLHSCNKMNRKLHLLI